LQILDMHGGVGGGLSILEAGYGGRSAARERLRPYLARLAELADGRRILFVHDLFTAGSTFPEDFFNLVQTYVQYNPVTDWVPDLQALRQRRRGASQVPELDQIGRLMDPMARSLQVTLGYCSSVRVDRSQGRPMLLVSEYRQRVRERPLSTVLPPEEVGVVVFIGPSDRFPEDLRRQDWFPIVNPPLLDRFFETKWLLPALLDGTPAARLLPRWIPVGMGFRTSREVLEFAESLDGPTDFPRAVLKPSHLGLSLGVRFLDRTALRALAVRQPARRLPVADVNRLLHPRIVHSYEEVTGYRGKQLDNLLRTPGAEVRDHGDGTFHFSAPYPFLESTVALLQEFVEGRPIRSRRTGRLHRGYLRVVLFQGEIVAALYRLDQHPDDGTFRDLTRQAVPTFFEGAPPSVEHELREELSPFLHELEQQFETRIQEEVDLTRLRDRWILEQVGLEA